MSVRHDFAQTNEFDNLQICFQMIFYLFQIHRRSVQSPPFQPVLTLPFPHRASKYRVSCVQAELRAGAEATHAETSIRKGRYTLPSVPMGFTYAGPYGGRHQSRR